MGVTPLLLSTFILIFARPTLLRVGVVADLSRPGFAFALMNICQAGRRVRDSQHLFVT